jgi:hypothetical protein
LVRDLALEELATREPLAFVAADRKMPPRRRGQLFCTGKENRP